MMDGTQRVKTTDILPAILTGLLSRKSNKINFKLIDIVVYVIFILMFIYKS